MCGRFALRWNRNEIRRDVEVDEWVDEDEFIPRYNIAPRTQAPVIRRRGGPSSSRGGTEANDGVVLQTMKWGLVPYWSKVEDKSLSTTNARSENLVEGGGMWGSIKGKKRCAIPCQGYYEWLTKGKDKLPHFTKRKDGKLLLMAGLYDCATIEGKPLWTFTIVTTDANKEYSWLHDRQPVFLTSKEALDRWLDTSSQTWTPELTKMVQPYSDETTKLECYQVPKEVGKVGTESPSFIEPVASRKDGIQAMFYKQRQGDRSSSPERSPRPHSGTKRKIEVSPAPFSSSPEAELSSTTPTEPPLAKKLKAVAGDDSNQPESAMVETISRDTKPRPKKSPTKRKTAKDPAGNKKIDSFFGKS